MAVNIDPVVMWKMGQITLPDLTESLSESFAKLEDVGSDFSDCVAWSSLANEMIKAFDSMRFDTLDIIKDSTWNIYEVAEALCEMAGNFAESDDEAASEINNLMEDEGDYSGKKIGDGPRDVHLPREPEEGEIPSFS